MANGARSIPPTHAAGELQPVCLICSVDEEIRAADPTGYIPRRVRIGPFYRDESHCMEEEKKNRLYNALGIEHRDAHREQVQPYLENMVQHHEDRARGHYHSLFSRMSSDDFVFMLLLDGYFVLYHFGLVRTEAGWVESTRVSNQYDGDVIFLLENQLPFFILEEIYKLLDPAGPNSGKCNNSIVLPTIKGYIETLLHEYSYVHSTVTLKDTDDEHPWHLVHLLYKYFRPANLGSDQNTKDEGKDPPLSSATYYHAAGVRLAMRNLDGEEARSILDVKLKNGTLQVPLLAVHNDTLTMLRNMVALEQHYPNVGSHVTIYCFFMSKLANTEEDVRLLLSKGILLNYLSSDKDVADGFANLCKGVSINVRALEFNYLRPITGGLEKLCHSRWGKSMAWLRHNKCNNLLMVLTVVAGIISFLCTVEQSSLAALSYGKQRP